MGDTAPEPEPASDAKTSPEPELNAGIPGMPDPGPEPEPSTASPKPEPETEPTSDTAAIGAGETEERDLASAAAKIQAVQRGKQSRELHEQRKASGYYAKMRYIANAEGEFISSLPHDQLQEGLALVKEEQLKAKEEQQKEAPPAPEVANAELQVLCHKILGEVSSLRREVHRLKVQQVHQATDNFGCCCFSFARKIKKRSNKVFPGPISQDEAATRIQALMRGNATRTKEKCFIADADGNWVGQATREDIERAILLLQQSGKMPVAVASPAAEPSPTPAAAPAESGGDGEAAP